MRNRWLSGIAFAGWLLGCAADGGHAEKKPGGAPPPAAETPGSDLSVLRIVVRAAGDQSAAGEVAASLLATDPEKRRTGEETSGRILTEIPRSTYEDEAIEDPEEAGSGAGWRVLEIQRPSAGRYSLAVRGSTDARYSLSLRAYDTKGEPADREWSDLPIRGGEVHVFALQYSPTPGAGLPVRGGFDGEGESRTEDDQILTYASITGRRTVLPAPAESVALLIVYGETCDSLSFRATWNDADAASRFTPLPGKCQVVTLPVRPGENRLVLHASGRSGAGRAGDDTDALTWVVPARADR